MPERPLPACGTMAVRPRPLFLLQLAVRNVQNDHVLNSFSTPPLLGKLYLIIKITKIAWISIQESRIYAILS
jgi:hypothetical protein